MTAGFPTLGEVVKYSFRATGIIPSKYEYAHSLSNKEKKKYQKALERLATEEGDINKSFQELGEVFIQILSASIKNRKILQVISDIIGDLVLVYGNVITDDGTYQDILSETLFWFMVMLLPMMAPIRTQKEACAGYCLHILFPDW